MAAAQLDSSATTRKSDVMPPHPRQPRISSLTTHRAAGSPRRRRVSIHQVRRQNVPLVRMLNVARLARVAAAHPRSA